MQPALRESLNSRPRQPSGFSLSLFQFFRLTSTLLSLAGLWPLHERRCHIQSWSLDEVHPSGRRTCLPQPSLRPGPRWILPTHPHYPAHPCRPFESGGPLTFSQSLLRCAWSVVSDSLRPCGLQPARLLCPWDSGKNTGVGCHALLQGTFPTQGSNPGLPPCGRILYQLSHQGSPWILEWVAYHFSRGSSQTRNRTWVSGIAGKFLTNWATRDTLSSEPMGSC